LKIALDADVMVHLVSTRSERHAVTIARLAEYRQAGAEFVIAENALLEAFSVLSRSPNPVGMRPADAEIALKQSFANAILAPIRPGLAWETIRHTLARGHAGGRIYDTAIALAAYEAGARLLLTWNVRHLVSVAPTGLEIRQP
jgi:predicted nucleic acid-binding protein